ncbi:hypothetical protein IFM47457_08010 [Aspergillus lentulus]|nr:hypothetical protein IFM47457_08010 [Aspergillus lentulus]
MTMERYFVMDVCSTLGHLINPPNTCSPQSHKYAVITWLGTHPSRKKQFSWPDQDWLFKPGYNHESKIADGSSCDDCDQSQLVVVHYEKPMSRSFIMG